MKQHRGEEGVSDMVSVILLVGLTVLGVAVMAAVLLSGQPDEIPYAAIVAGNSSSGKFVLAHEGGDPLRAGEYRIYVDTGSGLEDKTDRFDKQPPGGAWSIGEILIYNGPGVPNRTVVTAVSGGGETVLAELAFR